MLVNLACLNLSVKAGVLDSACIASGYGLFEGAYLEGSIPINKGLKIGTTIGFWKYSKSNGLYTSVSLYASTALTRNKDKNGKQNWYASAKCFYWTLNDNYYKWDALAFEISVKRHFFLSNKLSIYIDAGPVVNLVLKSKRKTFEEVGWPYHVRPGASIGISYAL